MKLQAASIEIFDQLTQMTEQFTEEEYRRPLPVLSNNSVGRHLRHVIEFYDLAVRAVRTGGLDYDRRERNLALENSPREAVLKMKELMVLLRLTSDDAALQLEACYASDARDGLRIDTTFYRELIYNIEHAVHHMAIIAIAVRVDFSHIALAPDFGVAYSTVKHKQTT